MFKKYCSKSLMLFITILILFFAINTVSFAEGHWADNEIQYLLEKQIVSGYADGSFKPDKDITRAEFIKIVNNVLGLTEKAEVQFKDVNQGDWFHDEIAKALRIGYIDGYGDNTLRPNNPITREEVAKIMVVAFDLEDKAIEGTTSFNDNNEVSDWAKEYVNILHNGGYVSGYLDGTFRPSNPITRAEVVKMTTNVNGNIVNTPGELSNNITGNLLVSASNTYLKDIHIAGDLYLVEGIGDGKVILDNVTVDGNIYIRSGEIEIKNSKANKVATNRVYKDINISLDNTEVPLVKVNTATKLVVKEGTSIKNLEVAAKSNIEIEKNANVDNVQIKAKDMELKVNGDIGSIVSDESFKLNGEIVEKGKDLSIKDGKISDPKEKESESEKSKDDEDEDYRPVRRYEFTANLDKDKYKINDDIKVSGKVTRNKTGLEGIHITLKVVDNEGKNTIFVEQLKTNASGQFTNTFKLPEGITAGTYKIVIKANSPVNEFKVLDLIIVEEEKEDKYEFTANLDKVEYKVDEDIEISGKALKNDQGLDKIDITLKLVDSKGTEIITVDQIKTNAEGEFTYKFKAPEGTKAGEYKIILKANEPVNIFMEKNLKISNL